MTGAAIPEQVADGFRRMWRELLPVGRSAASGGYRRYAWTAADAECRAWFAEQARARGMRYEVDRNGNQWAWLGDPSAGDAVVTGSHLDSVPDGGAYDGPLGVLSAFAAVDALRARGSLPAPSGTTGTPGTPGTPGHSRPEGPRPSVPGAFRRPLAVVNFVEEEGARFGVACAGSRLMTGAMTPDAARSLRDAHGVTMADAMESAGQDPSVIGPDSERVARIGAYVELHIEQGRHLAATPHAVGVASAIWPHGRWRFDFRGEANHAGTTRLEDRHDPMLGYAATVLGAREAAGRAGGVATFGRVRVEPNGTNAIASMVTAWLDCRAADSGTLETLVKDIVDAAEEAAETVEVTRESFTPVVNFDVPLRDRIARLLGDVSGSTPVLPTGAGHDAGILAAVVPTAMLFVRNPTGVSHSPQEHAGEDDCLAGVAALATVLDDLL